MSENQSKRTSNSLLVRVCVLVVLVGALTFFLVSQKNNVKNQENVPRKVAIATLADQVYTFLAREFGSSGALLTEYECDELQQCSASVAAGNPHYAWALLAHARQYQLSKVRGDNESAEVARQQLTDFFAQWIYSADFIAELYSLHQIAEVYQVSGYESFLKWFWDRLSLIESHARDKHVALKGTFITQPYLAAALARQLAIAVLFLENPDTYSILLNDKRLSPEQQLPDYQSSLLDLSAQVLEAGFEVDTKELTDEAFIAGDRTLNQFICFKVWTAASLLQTDLGKQKFEKTYLPESISVFNKLFGDSAGDISFPSLQNVLPCLQALQEFQIEYPEALNYNQYIERLLARHIVPLWDGANLDRCSADGAVFSYEDKGGGCAMKKALVDNSWLFFLLPEKLRSIEVEVK